VRLAICEKPSVAKSVAAVLGADKNRDGYMEGNGYLVSWCYGHLVELAPPAAYGEQYKRWSRADLPILPEAWKYTTSGDKQKQLDTLRALMSRPDVEYVVNGCDAGREGELIFRLVYEYCECQKPTKRLWISSMEDAAIREGFASLKDGAEYDNLYHAALCRAKADYLVGMNITRLLSCLYGATLSAGRVQSPTLAILAERESAVLAFVPEPFYTPVIDTGAFTASGERLASREDADAVRAACDGGDAAVLSVERQIKTEAPPRLDDLTALQRDANRLLGYTAQQTLDVAQSLYEKKLATYPRTDSRHLTEDMAAGLPALVNAAAKRIPGVSPPVPVNAGAVINSAKVSDHHALIPTMSGAGSDAAALPTAERNILLMLTARLVCAVGEPHRYEAVTATLECVDHTFTAKGRSILQDGWKTADAAFRSALKEKPEQDENADGGSALPELSDGQTFSPVAASVKEGKTSPPKRFTEDTLLAAMESAGADEAPEEKVNCSKGAREATLGCAERKGLGTPATRAGMIEKLVKSGSAERKKKLLIPTEKGINLIAILPEELKSPLLTAEWEHRLIQVQRGELSDETFMDGIAALVSGLVAAHAAPLPAFASLFAPPPQGAVAGKCPRCGADVIEAAKGFFCSSRACRFALWKDSRFWSAKGKKLDKKTANALLTEGRVFFSDLKSEKTGKTYAAAVLLEDDGQRVNYKLDFTKERKAA
jgi:DNA topoisomerase-3